MKNDKSFNSQLYSGDKEHKQKKKRKKDTRVIICSFVFINVQEQKHLPGKSWMYQGADHIHSVWKLC